MESEEGLEELSEVDARSVARGGAIGIEEGRREVRLSCAKKLIAANLLPLETISKVCCLSLEELRATSPILPNPLLLEER